MIGLLSNVAMQFLGARRPNEMSDHRRLVKTLLVFAPIVFVGNEVSLAFRYPEIGAAVLFPPYAILTAALLVSRRRDWVWFILIDTVAHLVAHYPEWSLSWVLFASIANVARAALAATLLTGLFGGPPQLDNLRALWVYLVSAVLIAPLVGATIGAANVVLHASPTYWHTWIAWFVSNAITGLTMLPVFAVVFAYTSGWYRIPSRRERVMEALLLGILLCVTCVFVFFGVFGARRLALPLSAALPILVWSALRFRIGGASVTLTVLTYAAIWSVDRGIGPIVAEPPDDNILALQIFVLFTAVPVLFLAAIATGRQSIVRLHSALLASLHDHIALLDANGAVIEVNESWRRFAELSNAPLFHRVRAGDDFLVNCQSSARSGDATAAGVLAGVRNVLNRQMRRFEIDYDSRDSGHTEWYTMSVEALERIDGGAVVRRANITARRKAQMEIEEQRRELSYLARVAVLGQLSGAFAHELNQPLTAILSNAETARQVLRRDPANMEYVGALLRDIIADDRRAAEVIHRLRGMLKRGDRRFQRIETLDLVGEVLELAHTELITRHVEATAAINPAVPTLWGDKVQLQQVLLNLILNGCEAMNVTQESRRRLVLTVDREGPLNAHVAVRDSGSGFPAELIDRLFEPFVTTKPDGLGLGLSISRTIIAAHGGRLWGENNPDGGATMHCVLPVRRVAALPPSAMAWHP